MSELTFIRVEYVIAELLLRTVMLIKSETDRCQ